MPSNLFVVIFPRNVHAHTVFVTRRDGSESSGSGGRSSSGKKGTGKQRRGSKSGKLRSKVEEAFKSGANREDSTLHEPEIGDASSPDRSDLERRKTVRIQLSRPTDELEPDPAPDSPEAVDSSKYTGDKSTTGGAESSSGDIKSQYRSHHSNDSDSAVGGRGAQRRSSSSEGGEKKKVSSAEDSKEGPDDADTSAHGWNRGMQKAAGVLGFAGSMFGGSEQEPSQRGSDGGDDDRGRDRRGSGGPEHGQMECKSEDGEMRSENTSRPGEDETQLERTGQSITMVKDPDGGQGKLEVTEVIGNGDVDVSAPEKMEDGAKVNIEALVREILLEIRTDKILIGEPAFYLSAGGMLMTCMFPCDGQDSHLVLTKLESVGVGSEVGSVNVIPMEIGRSDITRRQQRDANDEEKDKLQRKKDKEKLDKKKKEAQRKKKDGEANGDSDDGCGISPEEEAKRRANDKSRALACQIRVTQVTEEIREGTNVHFDYLALLVASSIISAMGLATDDTTVVVAAMLVSPIMGPILAFTFGTNLRDWQLAKTGFLVESMSLLICVVVGMVVGGLAAFFFEEESWPTQEMESRGDPWGLATGIAIAVPSGITAALSILSKNVSSLVGVAISASLLPPAVNTGLCLAFAALGPKYSTFDVDAMEFVSIGLISMALVIVNIVCIYGAGVALFFFKEVAPLKAENSFWSRDIINARKFRQGLKKGGGRGNYDDGDDGNPLRKRLWEEANRLKAGDEDGTDTHEKSSAPDSDSMPQGRKSSLSSLPNKQQREGSKNSNMFDMFGDAFDTDDKAQVLDGGSTLGNKPARDAQESPELDTVKSEGGGMLKGLVAALVNRGEASDPGSEEERRALRTRRPRVYDDAFASSSQA